MKKNKKAWIVLVLVLAVILLAGLVGVGYYQDRQKFIEATNNVKAIVNLLSVSSAQSKQQYCQRNNIKYEKGSLLCTTETSLILGLNLYDDQSLIKLAKSAGWQYKGSNLDLWQSADKTYKYAQLYKHKDTDCYIRAKSQDKKEVLSVGCYASAKAEWYPIRNS